MGQEQISIVERDSKRSVQFQFFPKMHKGRNQRTTRLHFAVNSRSSRGCCVLHERSEIQVSPSDSSVNRSCSHNFGPNFYPMETDVLNQIQRIYCLHMVSFLKPFASCLILSCVRPGAARSPSHSNIHLSALIGPGLPEVWLEPPVAPSADALIINSVHLLPTNSVWAYVDGVQGTLPTPGILS